MQDYMYLFEIVITFVEGFILLLYLKSIFQVKNKSKKVLQITTGAILYTIIITVINTYQTVSVQGILAMILILTLETMIINRVKFFSSLTATTILVVMNGMLEMMVICSISILKSDPDYVLKIIGSSNLIRGTYIILIKVAVIAIYFFVKDKLAKLNPTIMDNRVFRIITAVGFLLNIKVSELLNINQFVKLKLGLLIMFVGFMIAIILIMLVTQRLIDKIEKEGKQELYNLKNNLLEQNMKNLSLLYAENSKKIHDFNNHINTIKAMAENNQSDKLIGYISQLGTSQAYKSERLCQNEMLNIILNVKLSQIADKNINFKLNIVTGKDINIDDFDLCGLMANVLDNAIEAVENEADKDISVIVEQRNKLLFISVENYSSKNPMVAKFMSSKIGNHGWGTKIIEDIVRKYEGEILHKYNDNRYTVEMMLPEKINNK